MGCFTNWTAIFCLLSCLAAPASAAVYDDAAEEGADKLAAQTKHLPWHQAGGVHGMSVMFGWPDWKVGFNTAASSSKCIEQVNRIANRMGVGRRATSSGKLSSIKFSPYFFYTWAMPADQVPGEDKYYRHKVVQWLVRDATYKQVEPTEDHMASYTADFAQCLSTAISLGFRHLFINPMIDVDYNQPDCCPWRNAAEFDPTQNLTGLTSGKAWSYESLVVQPTLDAIKRAVSKSKMVQISYGFGAEQGRTFTVYGAKWSMLATKVKSALNSMVYRSAVGPHFDPLKMCGYYCDFYSNSTKVTDAQWADFRTFLSTSDMFGVSSYPNVWEKYDPNTKALDVAQSVRVFDTQLKQFAGTSISEQRAAGNRFIFNELGLGGCKDYGCDGTNTPDIEELSIYAWNGQGSFESYDNPPKVIDPFRHMWTKAFRMEWWRQQLKFFSDTKNPFSPDDSYVWVVGSWDIAAVYHASAKGQNPDAVGCDPKNSYCDPEILDMVKAFNKAGSLPKQAFVNLPGPAYYTVPAMSIRSRTVPAAAQIIPQNVPDWAQPLVLGRPVWG